MFPFVVLALPRSRTFWLSRLLSYGGRRVDHDPSRFFRGRDDVAAYFRRPGAAAADTALGRIWSDVAPSLPRELRVVVVHRKPEDVADSLILRCGVRTARAQLVCTQGAVLSRLRAIGGLHVSFAALAEERTCARVFEYCLGCAFDRAWWSGLKDQNLQCDRAQYVRDAETNVAGVLATFGHDEERVAA